MKNRSTNKKCPCCSTVKCNDEFGIRYGKILRSYCRECERIRKKKYDIKNKEKIRKKSRERYLRNATLERERARIYREKNREMVNAYYKTDRIRLRRRKRQKERMIMEPKFRLRRSISSCIKERLKTRLSNKNNKSTFDFLSFSLDDLIKHLEEKFKPRMSWNNYGEWHIDHIIPDASFNYCSVEDNEFQKCWSLSNLQPLWAKDNLFKSDKIL